MPQHLDQSLDFIDHISKVAALHDIGKVAIPEIIKLQRGLHPDELTEMRMHTVYGAQIIDKMLSLSGHREPRLEMAKAIALHHHQRWDGKGYPGLIDENGRWSATQSKSFVDYARLRPPKGDEIPLAARMVSLADKYDALRSARSYKPPLSHPKTCQLLTTDDRHGSRGEDLFGADLFGVFLDISNEFDMIYEEMRDDPILF
jgi:response regulator RpfG family c-di-GMP phosphodiesterase